MRSFTSLVSDFARIRHLCLFGILALTMSACSTMGVDSDEGGSDYALIAENLVSSLTQISNLEPQTTTVQVSKAETGFAREVQSELREQGYTLEWSDGINQVTPEIKSVKTDAGEQRRYVVSIGQVSAERAYSMVNGNTVPASELVIRGTRQSNVSLNDDIFEGSDAELNVVEFQPYNGPQVDDMLSAAGPGSEALSWWQREKPSVVKKNLYETLTSNYSSVFEGYEDLEQSILVFPNDSMRLGDANKQIIEHYVATMDPKTDIVSVIGCSHGETNINNGNSLLALGRASRVKEALMFSGLEHDQIMEEGCWAPRLWDEVMPRRGVVLTLKRQKKS